MSDYVNQTIEQLGKEILAGKIDINPYELKGNTACTWCAYRSICGFDERLRGCNYRKLEQIRTEEDIFAAMEQKTKRRDLTEKIPKED